MSTVVKVIQSPEILKSSQPTQFIVDTENFIQTGVKTILLDLKHVTFMSSADLMALVSLLKAAKAAGCNLLVSSMSEQVRMLFEITGLDQVFEIFKD